MSKVWSAPVWLNVAWYVSGMRVVIAKLTMKDTGRFLDYRGKELPW